MGTPAPRTLSLAARAARRLLALEAVHLCGRGLLLGSFAAAVAVAAIKVFPLLSRTLDARWAVVVCLASGAVMGLILALARWPHTERGARELDRRFNLRDALSSALQFASATPAPVGMHALAIDHAESLAATLRPGSAIPITWPWHWRAWPIPAAAALAAAIWIPARVTSWGDSAARFTGAEKAREAAIASAKDARKKLEQSAPDSLTAEALEEIRALEAELAKPDSVAQAASAARALEQSAQHLDQRADKNLREAEQALDSLWKQAPAPTNDAALDRPLSESLARGDAFSAADAIESIDKFLESQPAEQRAQALEKLRELQQAIEQWERDRAAQEQQEPPATPETQQPPEPADTQPKEPDAPPTKPASPPPQDGQRPDAPKTPPPDSQRPQTSPQQPPTDANPAPQPPQKSGDQPPPGTKPDQQPKPTDSPKPGQQPSGQPQPDKTSQAPGGQSQPAPTPQPGKDGQPQPAPGQPQTQNPQTPEPGNPPAPQPKPTEGSQPSPQQPAPQPQPGQGQPAPQPDSGATQQPEPSSQPKSGSAPAIPGVAPQPQPGATDPNAKGQPQPTGDPAQQDPQQPPLSGEAQQLVDKLRELGRRMQSAKDAQDAAQKLRETAQRILDNASPQEREALERLARDIAQQGDPGSGVDGPEAPPRPAPSGGLQQTTQTTPVDARPADAPKAPEHVLADMLRQDPVERPEPFTGPTIQQGIAQAVEGAERGIESQSVPREQADFVRRVFRRYAERFAPTSVPAAPAKPSAPGVTPDAPDSPRPNPSPPAPQAPQRQ